MNHLDLKSAFYKKTFYIYTKISWKHLYEDVGAHDNSDHHRLPRTSLIVK